LARNSLRIKQLTNVHYYYFISLSHLLSYPSQQLPLPLLLIQHCYYYYLLLICDVVRPALSFVHYQHQLHHLDQWPQHGTSAHSFQWNCFLSSRMYFTLRLLNTLGNEVATSLNQIDDFIFDLVLLKCSSWHYFRLHFTHSLRFAQYACW